MAYTPEPGLGAGEAPAGPDKTDKPDPAEVAAAKERAHQVAIKQHAEVTNRLINSYVEKQQFAMQPVDWNLVQAFRNRHQECVANIQSCN